jgi:hypothetical protein
MNPQQSLNNLEINYFDLFQQRLYKKTDLPQNIAFTIRGKIIGTLGNFCIFSGLPKASKSTFLAGAIASAFLPGPVYGMKITLPEKRANVLYVDTESAPWDYQAQMNKIARHIGSSGVPKDLMSISVREDNPQVITGLVDWYLSNFPDCSVLILDGLLDLIWNYNDERESRVVINWLKKITKMHNILVIGVLHLSKGTGQTLGHFGSLADRYAQSVLEIVKNNDARQFAIKPKFLRSSDDFEPVAIHWDEFLQKMVETSYIEIIDNIKKQKNGK